MKSEIYDALAALNRGADMQLESLAILETQGILKPDYVEYRKQIIEEARSVLNYSICNVLGTSEAKESFRLEQVRMATEARLKES